MSTLENTFQVAIFDRFLEAFARIPRAQQKKVHNFIRKFRADPTSSSINYERIASFADPNLRTVRIDDAWRAIVLKPDQGNVYVLLWVDHHDEAMSWARQKRVEVHPETGGLQVYTLQAAAPDPEPAPPPRTPAPQPSPAVSPPPEEAAPPPAGPLFQAHSDADLRSVGVPEALLPAVRGVLDRAALDRLASTLPPEAHEALHYLSEGESVDEVRRAIGLDLVAAAQTRDIAAALATPTARRSFVLVEDDETLSAMLDAPLEKWRIFLHPSQRKLVERSWSGPVRVLGGAGTGKTVVAMHRAAWLVSRLFTGDGDRVLFTTFTANLAEDIRDNLSRLVPAALLRRVEVVHLDRWVTDFLNQQGYRYQIDYWQRGSGRPWELWRQAYDALRAPEFPESFFREEWELVVQPTACQSEDDYIAARRAGRGVRLSRAQRRATWPMFVEYRNLLEEAGLRESADAMRDAAGILERREVVLGYRSILVDEAQDMSTVAFHLLRQIIPEQRADDLFIVGDGHQQIYRRKVVLSQAGVAVVGRSHRLRVNYRTTDEIRRFAVGLLDGQRVDDLDGAPDTLAGYTSLMRGAAPEIRALPDFGAEVEAIARFAAADDLPRTCLVARTNTQLDRYAEALRARGLSVCRLSRSKAENHAAPGLRLATMHRVKGLEFDRVIVAGLTADTLPLRSLLECTDDPAVREELERQERALLYVAITRAKREVLVTCAGEMSAWVSGSGAVR